MKIVDARTGKLQTIPFTLGEAGRGRHLEEIRISNRPGQEPSGPEDVSYFTFGPAGSQHVILTRGDARRGLLLRISSRGVYTKYSSGRVSLVGGQATLLVSGSFAEGLAGRAGGATDGLWHVEGPSVWDLVIQGGEGKGCGHRYVVVTRSLRVVTVKRADLAQLIATDGDPEVTEVARQFSVAMHEDVQSAIRLSDQLEEATAAPVAVAHFVSEATTVRDVVRSFEIAIPAAMDGDGDVGGVSGVEADTLVPGSQELLCLYVGPGGGKRYGYSVQEESGIVRLREQSSRPYTRARVLALVTDTAWRVRWTEFRDGQPTSYVVADAGGVHTYEVFLGRAHTAPWPGRAEVPLSAAQILSTFDASVARDADATPSVTPAAIVVEPDAPATLDDLRQKFGK